MPWWLACILTNLSVVVIEYHYRTGDGLLSTLWSAWPFIIALQITLYYAYNGAPSMMMAWTALSLMGVVFRLGNSHFLVGEPITPLVGAGVLCVVVGTVLIHRAAA